MDFSLSDDLAELRERTERFVREKILPYERDPRQTPHGPTEDLRRELVALGGEAGLLSPHVGRDWGGLGLDHRGKAIVFEAAGYSPLGPVALNCFAPDEGNMHLLEQIAEERQKQQWLRPLAAGEIRSCFMMTEPAPGAGADPSMLMTTARRDGDHFVIDGRKWLITGAVGADLGIVMAKNDSDAGGPAGATMFLTPMNASGINIERVLDTLDQYMIGGHAVVRIDGLRVHESAVLGRVGEGFRYAQVRLAPARLTHCMRWLGAARRAHDIATDYARRRTAFGKPLGEHPSLDLTSGTESLQSTRVFWRDCAHLQHNRSWPCASKNSLRARIDGANGFIVGQARKNHIGSARQINNVLSNDTALCCDGFRLGDIHVVYDELVSLIKQTLCDPASHVA